MLQKIPFDFLFLKKESDTTNGETVSAILQPSTSSEEKSPDTTNGETVSPILQPFTSSEEKSPVHTQVSRKY